MKVFPVAGREGLLDPITRRKIPAEGWEVPQNGFWMRRLQQGDVTLVEPKTPEPETPPHEGDHQ
jgi:hypothetical protein